MPWGVSWVRFGITGLGGVPAGTLTDGLAQPGELWTTSAGGVSSKFDVRIVNDPTIGSSLEFNHESAVGATNINTRYSFSTSPGSNYADFTFEVGAWFSPSYVWKLGAHMGSYYDYYTTDSSFENCQQYVAPCVAGWTGPQCAQCDEFAQTCDATWCCVPKTGGGGYQLGRFPGTQTCSSNNVKPGSAVTGGQLTCDCSFVPTVTTVPPVISASSPAPTLTLSGDSLPPIETTLPSDTLPIEPTVPSNTLPIETTLPSDASPSTEPATEAPIVTTKSNIETSALPSNVRTSAPPVTSRGPTKLGDTTAALAVSTTPTPALACEEAGTCVTLPAITRSPNPTLTACPNDCNGHGTCSLGGVCECATLVDNDDPLNLGTKTNWTGETCSVAVVIFPKAICGAQQTCANCQGKIDGDGYACGWSDCVGGVFACVPTGAGSPGENCVVATCSGGVIFIAEACPDNCSNEGACAQNGSCICKKGVSGINCGSKKGLSSAAKAAAISGGVIAAIVLCGVIALVTIAFAAKKSVDFVQLKQLAESESHASPIYKDTGFSGTNATYVPRGEH